MSITSEDALLQQAAINAACAAKNSNNNWLKEKAKEARLKPELHRLNPRDTSYKRRGE